MPDLFDFFKENESKLHELPSEQVWKKLEGRLERRARKRRKIRFLNTSIWIALIAILLLAGMMVLYFVRKEGL